MPLADAPAIAFVITRDRKAAEAFYGGTLGLRRLPEEPFAAVFDLAGRHLRVTEVPDYRPGEHPVLGWAVPDIVAAVRDLAGRGVVMTIYEGMGQDELGIWTSPDGASKVAFFADPDGNVLSLTQG